MRCPMMRISYEEFMQMVAWRKRSHRDQPDRRAREKVLRPDQRITFRKRRHDKRLATCPGCDAVVDADILDPHSGLCPICHEEAWRR